MFHVSAATIAILFATLFFFVLERVRPGRALPYVSGWYSRAIGVNLVQLLFTASLNRVWNQWLSAASIVSLRQLHSPGLEGFIAWMVGSFFFYWWHRVRHANGFWRIFHQLHHSPARIEVVTSFYKHPIEILSNAIIQALVRYPLLGTSLGGAVWANFFAATAEYMYHANFKASPWFRYFIQTPELHSVHHQLNVHRYNYADLPIWDRLFGTYKDAVDFAPACGFPRNNERHLADILLFRDVYNRNG
jgi:sterol desaturase/sphingolipid hydroxylase (fatty acid hydroxylase superfamily)